MKLFEIIHPEEKKITVTTSHGRIAFNEQGKAIVDEDVYNLFMCLPLFKEKNPTTVIIDDQNNVDPAQVPQLKEVSKPDEMSETPQEQPTELSAEPISESVPEQAVETEREESKPDAKQQSKRNKSNR
jgi:hypothetical protein